MSVGATPDVTDVVSRPRHLLTTVQAVWKAEHTSVTTLDLIALRRLQASYSQAVLKNCMEYCVVL